MRPPTSVQTLDMQRSAILRAAKARGDTVTTWYSEKQRAQSIARPVLICLRADARAGQIQRLYIYRLDRPARSGIRDTFEVVEELQATGCELVTVSDGFDLTGPAAEVVLAVMAWAAQMERLAINERIAAARTRLESEGRPWGRPPSLQAEQRARALRLRRDGRSVRSIAQALKVSRSVVHRVIAVSQKDALKKTSRNPRQTARQVGPVRK